MPAAKGIRCPECRKETRTMLDSRPNPTGRRRRWLCECGHRFNSYEVTEQTAKRLGFLNALKGAIADRTNAARRTSIKKRQKKQIAELPLPPEGTYVGKLIREEKGILSQSRQHEYSRLTFRLPTGHEVVTAVVTKSVDPRAVKIGKEIRKRIVKDKATLIVEHLKHPEDGSVYTQASIIGEKK